MANAEFKSKLTEAIAILRERHLLVQSKSFNLYTYAKVKGAYNWQTVQNADGLLLAERNVLPSGGTQIGKTSIIIGIIIQSEYTTSDTKPNPQGKAALANASSRLWFCKSDGKMLRIDTCRVLFVLPKGAAPTKLKRFKTTRENVQQAVSLHPNSTMLTVNRGISAKSLAKKLYAEIKTLLSAVGRPRIRK